MHRSDRICLIVLGLLAGAALAACSSRDAAPATAAPATAKLSALSSSDLQTRARAAFAANRLYAPEGQNAAEFLLALRDRGLAKPADLSALAELEPYLVIAVEQAVDRGDDVEATRIRTLLQRANANAPALTRLAVAVDRLRAQKIADAQAVATATAATVAPISPPVRAPTVDTPRAATSTDAHAAVQPPQPRAIAASNDSSTASPLPSFPPSQPVEHATTAVTTPAPIAPAAASGTPKLIRDTTPAYPRDAFARGIEGEVDVRFTIDSNGHVQDARAVASTPGGVFDRAAVTAASRWLFESGHAPVTITRHLTFRMPEG
ncbi:energy transducer TonB [Lysobacter claricitrinus]|uniref:energy transducer TonB n=1 Tax=Lysobacter claricitrinus TaxID=3367728 RepID=UPI0037DB3D79